MGRMSVPYLVTVNTHKYIAIYYKKWEDFKYQAFQDIYQDRNLHEYHINKSLTNDLLSLIPSIAGIRSLQERKTTTIMEKQRTGSLLDTDYNNVKAQMG